MWRFEQIWDKRNRTALLSLSAVAILIIAIVDYATKAYISLGFLYLFPIMLAAAFLPRWAVVLVGIACAVLSDRFSYLDPTGESFRLTFETLALGGCGLFVSEIVRNRRLTMEAQERLRILVETSPAAILTIDDRGFIELANAAATELFGPREGTLVGHPVAAFLPELHHALRHEEGPQFRTSMRCRGHRASGESFMADVWFSTFKEAATPKLAAIIGEVTDEPASTTPVPGVPEDSNGSGRVSLGSREVEVLRFVVQGLANKEIAARMEISESAVKNVLQQLFAKTGVRSRSQLVRVALEQFRDLL